MTKHDRHSHCKHDLEFCEHCDQVWCTKCEREWGATGCSLPHYYVQYLPGFSYYFSYYPSYKPLYGTTSGGVESSTDFNGTGAVGGDVTLTHVHTAQ